MPFLQEILLFFAGVMVIVGFIGCIIPIIPGAPISYAGLLLLHFTKYAEFSYTFLIIFLLLTILAGTADNILTVLGTKKFGGSKRAVWGAVLGLIAGLIFFPPFGIIIGPFLGALALELTTGKEFVKALKSSFGSFAGFMAGVLIKIIVSGFMVYYFIQAVLNYSKGTIA